MKRALPVFILIFFFSCSSSLEQMRWREIDGQRTRLGQIMHENRMAVLVFLAADCPISQKYVRTLDSLQQRYPQVAFAGVFTRWETSESMQEFRQYYHTGFPLFQDEKNRLVRRLGATVTPEAYLLHGESVWYHGAIDNWYYALGRYRPSPTAHYLGDAIEAALQNAPAPVFSTKALGCGIEL